MMIKAKYTFDAGVRYKHFNTFIEMTEFFKKNGCCKFISCEEVK